ncbi:hypothetical protein GH865_10175 [Rhodocyclus tenuis]|uniref:hypothetical protein n=1 Tax=Rhodocyclus gracilis TaxID=2929842 RepID=UPI001298CAEF|nr:hypothetical protein [Rhodocyclus gracilis]MRD73615.1 hypothetical protein [Rhodocyclus gracilis]
MYPALQHSHALTAALSLLFTLAWAAVAWGKVTPSTTLGGKQKVLYIANRAVTGIAGITGLAVTFLGPWREYIFPYLGLAAFVVHGIFAAISKRAYLSGEDSRRRIALLMQIAALLFASAVMATKFA